MWGKDQRLRQARREGNEGEGFDLREDGAEKKVVIGGWVSR